MSPRAAWRLETLDFLTVYDYVAGEADWFASGLPRAGRDATIPRVGDVARRDVPTCAIEDRVGDVRARFAATGWDMCLAVNTERVVLGRLRASALDVEAERFVEEMMESGPTTIRPDARLADVVARMQEKGAAGVVVTTPDGRLFGVLDQASGEEALQQWEAASLADGKAAPPSPR